MSERMEYIDLIVNVLTEHEKKLSEEVLKVHVLAETMKRQMMKFHKLLMDAQQKQKIR